MVLFKNMYLKRLGFKIKPVTTFATCILIYGIFMWTTQTSVSHRAIRSNKFAIQMAVQDPPPLKYDDDTKADVSTDAQNAGGIVQDNIKEEEMEDADFSPYSNHYLMKVHLLDAGAKEVLDRWKNSQLSKIKVNTSVHVCQRYEKEGREVKVHVLNVWKSNVKRKQLTLITQLGVDKLPVMERLLHHWTGPVSLALYCDEENLRILARILMRTNSSLLFRDNIVLHLVYQSGEFYPVNFLRNLVLNNTDFKYVMLSDVDFMPSYGSYNYILDKLNGGKLPKKHAFVIPAFEFPKKSSVVEYPKTKEDLVQLWLKKTVMVFHWKFSPGHRPTKYRKWVASNESYHVKFFDAYEPYIVIDREGVPPYPQQFVGRLGNKIAHLLLVHSIGYEFIVLSNAFLIHYPHPVTWQVEHFMCAKRAMYKFKDRMKKLYPDRQVS